MASRVRAHASAGFTPYHGSPASQGGEEVVPTPKGSSPRPPPRSGVPGRARPLGRGTGFTLIELLIVVVIVGILAAIAYPVLRKAIERGHKRHAQDVLLAIYSGERTYFFANGDYIALGPGDDWRQIGLDEPNNSQLTPVMFSVLVCNPPFCTPPIFTATANRGGGNTITVDQDRTITDSWPT